MKNYLLIIIIILLGCVNQDESKEVQSDQTPITINDTLLHEIRQIKDIIELSSVNIDTLSEINCGIYKIGSNNERVPGPSDYYLISTFKLCSIDTSKYKKINILESPLEKKDIYYKEWLPKNISSGLFDSLNIKGLSVYSPDVFYKSPYLEGFFILLADSSIYLNMHTR